MLGSLYRSSKGWFDLIMVASCWKLVIIITCSGLLHGIIGEPMRALIGTALTRGGGVGLALKGSSTAARLLDEAVD